MLIILNININFRLIVVLIRNKTLMPSVLERRLMFIDLKEKSFGIKKKKLCPVV